MKEFCLENSIPINSCGKLVVAKNEQELESLKILFDRGIKNEINVELLSEEDAKKLNPHVTTFKQALYSPETASVDPKEVCNALKKVLIKQNISIMFNTSYKSHSNTLISTDKGKIQSDYVINTAGLYTDKIARDMGLV